MGKYNESMKRITLLLLCFSLLISCSVRLEKRVYNNGYYHHFYSRNNPEPKKTDLSSISQNITCNNVSLPARSYPLTENVPVSLSHLKEKKQEFSPPESKKKSTFLSKINFSTAKDDSAKVLIVHPLVGEMVDSTEKVKYGLFDFWPNSNFVSARFLEKEGRIYLEGKMKSGEIKIVQYSELDFNQTATKISTPEKDGTSEFNENLVTGFLIGLYILLFLILLFILAILSIIALALGGTSLGTLAVIGSLALLGIVLRAMISSIEERGKL